jgi:hypothetical protein
MSLHDIFWWAWAELTGRLGGPLHFRFILQPLVAGALAIRAGIRDAKQGQPVYFWTMLTSSQERADLLRGGWKDIGTLFLVACALDIVYGLLVFHAIRPIQTLIVAVVLAVIPYLLIRGPANRIARRFVKH